jgi:hypothetical protein
MSLGLTRQKIGSSTRSLNNDATFGKLGPSYFQQLLHWRKLVPR